METDMMRNVFVSCCAAAAMLSVASIVAPTPAHAWWRYGYTARPYAYAYPVRPYYAYRPYRAYAFVPGPRVWVGRRDRWRW
jgi:hypothetical protein